MNRFKCTTLFDITQTGITGRFRPEGLPFRDYSGKMLQDFSDWTHARNQQRNLETIVQILCLRGQISDITTPTHADSTWSFEFSLDTPGAWGENLELIQQDMKNVPMIPLGVTEYSLLDYGDTIWLEKS